MRLRLIVANWRRIMKTFLATLALASAVAAPAFAQPTQNARARAYHQEQAPMVQMYGTEHYQRRPSNEDVNPDFQLGGNRS
jgi:hypothetical protein